MIAVGVSKGLLNVIDRRPIGFEYDLQSSCRRRYVVPYGFYTFCIDWCDTNNTLAATNVDTSTCGNMGCVDTVCWRVLPIDTLGELVSL